MPTKKIDKPQWQSYFEEFTKRHLQTGGAELARVEVLEPEIGVQLESSTKQLLGITYDPHEDALELSFTNLVHRIPHPREIHVIEDAKGVVTSIKVQVEAINLEMRKGHEEIVTLRPATGYAALPAPGN